MDDSVLKALQQRKLVAEIEDNGKSRWISATYWQTGEGVDRFYDGLVGIKLIDPKSWHNDL